MLFVYVEAARNDLDPCCVEIMRCAARTQPQIVAGPQQTRSEMSFIHWMLSIIHSRAAPRDRGLESLTTLVPPLVR